MILYRTIQSDVRKLLHPNAVKVARLDGKKIDDETIRSVSTYFILYVLIMLISVIICRSRSVSGSVIPAVLLHSVHNLVDQIYLQPLSTNPGVPFLAGEQGLITILFAALIVVVVILRWRRTRSSRF